MTDNPKTPWDDEKRADMEKWFKRDEQQLGRGLRFLLAVDQLFNVLLWNGSHNETISSHIGRRLESKEANRFEIWLSLFLDKLDYNHCRKSIGE